MDALVGGAFLSAALQVLFERLASPELLNLFWKRKKDGEELLRKLELTLVELSLVMDDAEKQQITRPAVKKWLDELEHTVYEADDLLDEIATQALRLKSEADHNRSLNRSSVLLNKVQPSTSSTSTMFDTEMFSEIEKIVGRLEYFANQKVRIGLKDLGTEKKKVSGGGPAMRRPSTSLVDESHVWGRDDDEEKIIQLLLADSNDEIDVIPIVGMGGLGKTTLAQLVYNDARVVDHFGTKSWACVSDDFDIFGVTRTILEQVSSEKYSDTKDLNTLQVKLKGSLTGKKFLIVLDDVWNENYEDWDTLKAAFAAGKRGSKIIVTTRNSGVALIMQPDDVHHLHLQELSEGDCWLLFANTAFQNGDFSAHSDLERIGRKIVNERCKGLPLAAKTLAGLLRSTRAVEEWNDVLKSDIWDLRGDNILPVLRLSYHYLPSHLKQCFAYCSIFPKDYEFEKENLVFLWIAQNFVQSKNNRTPEKIGNEYFHELLSRSFFQPSGGNNKSSFVMHDLVHDLAQVVSGQFSHRFNGENVSTKLRHFSYDQGYFDGFEKFEGINEAKFLRTFLPINPSRRRYLTSKVLNDILPTKRCLRVLSLSGYQNVDLTNLIGSNLTRLRYLDLSGSAIEQLPEWVCRLYNLQTLLLLGCRSLTTLPGDIVKLVQLRHLDILGTNLSEMPLEMSRLKGLRHLTAFVVGNGSGSRINELKDFHHLGGKLSISSLQNVRRSQDAFEAKLGEKEHLEELLLEWGNHTEDTQNEREVLENLQPHANLKSLKIKNYGGTRFPDWLGRGSYTNIVTVSLDNCKYCDKLPPFGQLSSLKHLAIARMDGITEVGPEFYGDCSLTKPFQSLETLRIEEMSEWEEWHHPSDDGVYFGQLRELFVIKCPKLVGGLPKDIPSWVSVEIDECPQLKASVPKTCAKTSGGELVLRRCDGVELGCQGLFSSLVKLEISGMQNLEELAPELCTLTNLKELSIEECPRLLSFPHTGLPPKLTMLGIRDLQSFVFELSSSTASGCSSSSLVSSASNGLPPTLKHINIEHCRKLVLPPLSEEIVGLEELYLENINDTPKTLPLGLFPKLRSLFIESCENFDTFSVPCSGLGFQNLTSLEHVTILCCPNMVRFSVEGGLPAPNLTVLSISDCRNLIELPQRMHTLLPSLEVLGIACCPEIESFPDGGLPSSLRRLTISKCKKLAGRRGEWGLQTLPSLTFFSFKGEDEDEDVPFPDEGLLPSTTLTDLKINKIKSLNSQALQLLISLRHLTISNCPQLQSLPEQGFPASLSSLQIWGCTQLQSLSERGFPASLSSLQINYCPRLQSLPEKGLPASLSRFEIQNCKLLKDRCQRNIGDDWHKIAHIPFIIIDCYVIC